MKRIINILIALSLFAPLSKAQQLDSTRLAPLDSLLGEYYEAMIYEARPAKFQECDFLIESCKDSLIRQWVATRIFEHYMDNPPLMGEEEVAVYVYDKWFASGKISFADEWLAFSAKLFVDFNRNSLLGLKAPELELLSPTGSEKIRVPEKGTPSVLYFYDTSCSKCKVASIMLPQVLETVSFPLTLFLIYTGQDANEWAEFRASFTIENPKVKLVHAWDPETESDYQKQYGVLSTPKMFLVGSDGKIEGRRLEPEALAQLLAIYEQALEKQKK
ncbi:MAG: redoxin domain-containing protein [Bacteroidales bacterium]|nr:redoxin domain-containing protein [Bacteroidales bacterium]